MQDLFQALIQLKIDKSFLRDDIVGFITLHKDCVKEEWYISNKLSMWLLKTSAFADVAKKLTWKVKEKIYFQVKILEWLLF